MFLSNPVWLPLSTLWETAYVNSFVLMVHENRSVVLYWSDIIYLRRVVFFFYMAEIHKIQYTTVYYSRRRVISRGREREREKRCRPGRLVASNAPFVQNLTWVLCFFFLVFFNSKQRHKKWKWFFHDRASTVPAFPCNYSIDRKR